MEGIGGFKMYPHINVVVTYDLSKTNIAFDEILKKKASMFRGSQGGSGFTINGIRDFSFQFKDLTSARRFFVAVKRFKSVVNIYSYSQIHELQNN